MQDYNSMYMYNNKSCSWYKIKFLSHLQHKHRTAIQVVFPWGNGWSASSHTTGTIQEYPCSTLVTITSESRGDEMV